MSNTLTKSELDLLNKYRKETGQPLLSIQVASKKNLTKSNRQAITQIVLSKLERTASNTIPVVKRNLKLNVTEKNITDAVQGITGHKITELRTMVGVKANYSLK